MYLQDWKRPENRKLAVLKFNLQITTNKQRLQVSLQSYHFRREVAVCEISENYLFTICNLQ